MARSSAGVGWLRVLVPGALLAFCGLAGAVPASGNLVVNGDAETHRCTDDWTAQTPVPGWRVLRGAASVLCYGAFAYTGKPAELPAGAAATAGRALFTAPGADTGMEQVLDLSAASAAIDRHLLQYALGAWLGGVRGSGRAALLTAVFLDAQGRASGLPVVLGGRWPTRRNTGLQAYHHLAPVPAGTRRVVLTLQFPAGVTGYANALADNVSLQVRGEGAPLLKAAGTVPPAAAVPALDHVVLVMMENTNYADVLQGPPGVPRITSRMPFLASLQDAGVVLSNSWATYHPSDQNYVAMVAGDTFRYGPVYYPQYDLSENHLGDLIEAGGRQWRSYVQGMHEPCRLSSDATGQGHYEPDDAPFAQFRNITQNPVRCAAHLRDLADFTRDVQQDQVADFSWIAADGWWNGEGAWEEAFDVPYSLGRQDAFLRDSLTPLLQSPGWSRTRSLLIITWDESLGWGWPDNRIPTLLLGSPGLLRAGSVLSEHVDGYSVLRTVEQGLGLPDLGRFDRYATTLAAAFASVAAPAPPPAAAPALLLDEDLRAWGTQAQTFGRVQAPAQVEQGQAIGVQVAPGAGAPAAVLLLPLGAAPTLQSPAMPVPTTGAGLQLPTAALAPGAYALWLRSAQGYGEAPQLLEIVPRSALGVQQAGVEIAGLPAGGASVPELREGGNLYLRYCRPPQATDDATWIGIFAVNTPLAQQTRAQANVQGNWLKAPATAQSPCGQAMAYTAKLHPGQRYRVQLLRDSAEGPPQAVGRSADFLLSPALPPEGAKATGSQALTLNIP